MPNISRRLIARVTYPATLTAKSLFRGAGPFPMRRLRLFQRLARSESRVWREYRDGLLSRLLEHAIREIPFYRDLPESLIRRVRQEPMEALAEFPILRKANLQSDGKSLLARDVPLRRMRQDYSGGSTGEPTRFWHDRRRDVVRQLGAGRDEMYTGWKPGEWIGMIWGAERDFFWKTSLLYGIQNAIAERYIGLNAFQMTAEGMGRFLEEAERRRPAILRCYASAADEFARFIEQSGLCGRARALGLRGVVTSAEKLYPFQRERIERVFGCGVFDRYGSRELDVVAMECGAHGGLHVSCDNVVLEIVDERGRPAPRGEMGRIVVTDLWNLGFALIRYDTDDLGRLATEGEPCTCGVTFPRLAAIEGRRTDFFTLADGTRVHGEYFTHLLYGVPGVRAFQFVQEQLDQFQLSVSGDRAELEKAMPGVLEQLRERLPGARIRMAYCEEIPPTAGGKRRFTISSVAAERESR